MIDWKRAYQRSPNNPHLFVTGVLGYLPFGVPNPNGERQLERWQDEFLRPENFFTDANGKSTNSSRHSVRSGHGVGKGTVIAWLSLWFLLTRLDTKVVITSNTEKQLKTNNWPELRKQARYLPDELRNQIVIEEELAYLKAAKELGFITPRTASRENSEALQGVHAENVLYLIDEASGIHEIVFEVAQGSLSSPGAISCLFSNPTRLSGYFHATHHQLRGSWKCHRVSSLEVSRASGHVEEIIRDYGRDSDRFRVRVLGEFPNREEQVCIPVDIIEAAKNRQVAVTDYRPIWGVDVGRFGSDASALAKRQGNRLLENVREWRGKDNMQLVGLIVNEWNETHEDARPAEIMVDVIGIGSGVVDRLKELNLPVRGINVAESSSISEKFAKLRDELWWKGREFFEKRDCSIPADEGLIAELSSPTYSFNSDGKIKVESKADTKSRTGRPSPNKADSFLLTLATPDTRKQVERRRRSRPKISAWAA